MIDFIGGPGRDRTDDLFHAIKDRLANPCIYNALVAPESPVSAPGTDYCSHDVPRIDFLCPCRNTLILRIVVQIPKVVKVIGSGLKAWSRLRDEGYNWARLRVRNDVPSHSKPLRDFSRPR